MYVSQFSAKILPHPNHPLHVITSSFACITCTCTFSMLMLVCIIFPPSLSLSLPFSLLSLSLPFSLLSLSLSLSPSLSPSIPPSLSPSLPPSLPQVSSVEWSLSRKEQHLISSSWDKTIKLVRYPPSSSFIIVQ